jgi:hypothetical protein
MCNKVTNEYGSLCKEGDTWIGERGLIFIPWIYDKLLIVFYTDTRIDKLNYIFQKHLYLLLVLILVIMMKL